MGIPRTKIYETIKRPGKENWVTVEKGRPGKVSPVCSSEAIGSRKAVPVAEIERMTQEFSPDYEKRVEQEPPETWIVRGIDNIAATTSGMMKRARTSLYLSGTLYYPEEPDPIKQQIAAAKRRGVIIRISANNPVKTKEKILNVHESFAPVTSGIQVAPEPFIRTLTIDGREIRMMFPLPEAESADRANLVALWVKNEMVTKAMNNVFNIMWANPDWTGTSWIRPCGRGVLCVREGERR
ncbi:TrmB family transcriptional regulator [Methanoregula sp.]|uniref:TrmB family transcriptional regulator n=1 Tax=Methanoregula sp. TaxID=2052170 RepID=UPI0035656959